MQKLIKLKWIERWWWASFLFNSLFFHYYDWRHTRKMNVCPSTSNSIGFDICYCHCFSYVCACAEYSSCTHIHSRKQIDIQYVCAPKCQQQHFPFSFHSISSAKFISNKKKKKMEIDTQSLTHSHTPKHMRTNYTQNEHQQRDDWMKEQTSHSYKLNRWIVAFDLYVLPYRWSDIM